MGLIANVYRSVSTQHADGTATMIDCTNGGWSAKFNCVTVVNVEGPFEPTPERPAVVLVKHPAPSVNHVYAVSVDDHESGAWCMMGGNFLHTSDSRFGEAVRDLLGVACTTGPVAIHDRKEG